MDFINLVNQRKSQRSYDPNKPIEKTILTKIAQAGVMAPSAANRQPWEFLIISTPELKSKIHESYPKKWFIDAPHILVVKGSMEKCWVRGKDNYHSLETDLTIAMDHMILAAHSLGVSTCWIAAFDPDILKEALQLKQEEKVYAITPLGYADVEATREKIRKDFSEVVSFL